LINFFANLQEILFTIYKRKNFIFLFQKRVLKPIFGVQKKKKNLFEKWEEFLGQLPSVG